MTRFALIPALALTLLLLSSCGTEPVDPAGFTGTTGGCGSFFVYRFNADATEAVIVDVDRLRLPVVDSTVTTFALTLPAEHVGVRIDRFDKRAAGFFCTDLRTGSDPNVEETWNAVSGSIHVAYSDGIPQTVEEFYRVSVRLENVIFENEEGERITVDSVSLDSINVGWYPG